MWHGWSRASSALGGTFLFVSLALLVAMGLAGVLRRWWWVVAAPVFVGLALLFTFVSPYLIPNTAPLRDPQLLADARALERSEGLSGTRVDVQDVHRFTTAPNAESGGLRRHAHGGPLGHAARRQLQPLGNSRRPRPTSSATSPTTTPSSGVGWLALFLIPASALIALLTRSRGGLARPEAVPVALLVLVALQLLADAAVQRRLAPRGGCGRLVGSRRRRANRPPTGR